jgi:hypothetical protein
LHFLAWLARAGSAVSFISESVMTGFKAGVALHLASTQLPKLFGVKGGHDDFWERMHVFLQHIGETNTTSLLLGCRRSRCSSSARSCCRTNRSRSSSSSPASPSRRSSISARMV